MSAFLLEVLVKSLALGAVALVCGMLLVKTPASVRRLFWLTAGLSMLVLPLLTTAVPKWPVLSDETPAVQVLWGQGPTPVSDATAAPVLPAPGAQPPSSLNPWLLLWASGTGLLLLRAGVGLIRVRRIIRNSAPCLDPTLNEAYANVANRIGLARKVELRLFDQICPCTAGLGIPVVLLPLDAANWTQAQLEATLAHELTHVRDSDWALQGLLEFMRALYWPNPLSWVVTEGFRRSAEQSADDHP